MNLNDSEVEVATAGKIVYIFLCNLQFLFFSWLYLRNDTILYIHSQNLVVLQYYVTSFRQI